MIIKKYQNKVISYKSQVTSKSIRILIVFLGLWSVVCGLWSISYAEDSDFSSINSVESALDAAEGISFPAEEIKPVAEKVVPFITDTDERNLALLIAQGPSEKETEEIEINGDKVEFVTDTKEIVATGNVIVFYKGTKITCQKMTVNNQTKEGVAEGDVRLEEKEGIIQGQRIEYNFGNQSGIIFDSDFRASPYFGRSKKLEKVSDDEMINHHGYITTCDFADPHWRLKSKKMKIYPGDKVQLYDSVFYVKDAPLLYIPKFSRSLRDPIMQVQIMPGKSKDFGAYALTAWKYNLTEDITGRIYLDYRQLYGIAEGFGVNYKSPEVGHGDFKYYYTQERNKNDKQFDPKQVDIAKVFQRYMIRWRHQWDIDEQTKFTGEYYNLVDSKRANYPNAEYNILKEFFYREYEKEMQPLTYGTFHHAFKYASVDLIGQPRTNRWYSQLEKLPELDFSLPSYHLGTTPFYFDNSTQLANYVYKNAVPSSRELDKKYLRVDTTNTVSIPVKVLFLNLKPFSTYRGTYYDRDVYGASTVLRSIYSAGTEVSTKFYRIFNLNTDFLKLNLNGLRHVITPTINYSYSNKPTVPGLKLTQLDGTDSITNSSNAAAFELSNVLQTKRDGKTFQLVNFLVKNTYNFKTSGDKGHLNNFDYILEVAPYSWMSMVTRSTYDRKLMAFSNVDYDFAIKLTEDRSFGFGQRYQRGDSNELTYDIKWRFNPKWKVSFLQRYARGKRGPGLKRGLREQEYILSRNFHCWDIDLTYNVTRDQGENIWLTARLKAFPELNFEYNQEYHKPKPGELGYN
ncbi:MAG: LptA/OstA family protein [Candidatus Omnitrophota bacterium]